MEISSNLAAFSKNTNFIIVNSLRTCSLGPRLQSGLSAGIDLTNSIHFWPNLEKKKSLDGIIMGRHSGCSQVLNHPYVTIITNAGSSIILVYSVIGKQLFFTKKARTESN